MAVFSAAIKRDSVSLLRFVFHPHFQIVLCAILPVYYYCHYYYYYLSFSRQHSLSDSKSPQFSCNLLNILPDLSNTVVYMVSILHLISSSFSLLYEPLKTIQNAPTTIIMTIIIVIYLFLS